MKYLFVGEMQIEINQKLLFWAYLFQIDLTGLNLRIIKHVEVYLRESKHLE